MPLANGCNNMASASTDVITPVGTNNPGDTIPTREKEVYMIVFNPPYSKHLVVKTPKGYKNSESNCDKRERGGSDRNRPQ